MGAINITLIKSPIIVPLTNFLYMNDFAGQNFQNWKNSSVIIENTQTALKRRVAKKISATDE
jgi:hypothetical protein